MERAYGFPIFIRFKVSAEDAKQADAIAGNFAGGLAGWIDGGLGSPPFAPWLTAWVGEEPRWLEDHDATKWPLRP